MPNVVELNGMKKVGKELDASTCLLVSWNSELSKQLQEEDGGMLNAIPELVSTPSEQHEKVLNIILDVLLLHR